MFNAYVAVRRHDVTLVIFVFVLSEMRFITIAVCALGIQTLLRQVFHFHLFKGRFYAMSRLYPSPHNTRILTVAFGEKSVQSYERHVIDT